MNNGSSSLFSEKQAQTYLENFAVETHGILVELSEFLNASETPEFIYHYTNDVGLYGLISSGDLWLNDVYGMNDPTEIGHGITIALKILSDTKGRNENLLGILKKLLQRYHDEGMYQSVSSVFVSSFSRQADDLSQWRAYADNGRGYALCFDAKALERHFLEINREHCITGTFNISYDELKCKEFTKKAIDAAERFLLAAIILSSENTPLFQKYAINIVSVLTTVLYNIATGFKNSKYSVENEFRFMLHYQKPVEDVGALVRTRPYQMIRYLKFPWKSLCSKALLKVITGPSGGYQSERFANDLKRQYGMAGIEVIKSEVPYRT